MATVLAERNLAEVYASASPFPHIVLDGHFAADRIAKVAREVRQTLSDPSAEFYGQHRKGGTRDRRRMWPTTNTLIDELNSPGFVRWLSHLTGIPDLVADPSLFAGGIHQTLRGGFLKIHADFNWHAEMRLYRRVNVLLYLNEEWRDEWGGQLELWHTDMSACGASIAPTLGRMVVFSTTDDSFHGHPEPLACPAGVTRNSIAMYYYSAEPAPGMRMSEITNYQTREGERFGVRHWLHRLRLKLRHSPSP
jgi:hypothetical protein